VKVRTRNQVNDRTAGGHIYSAGEGAVSVVDDADADMVALMRKLAAAGQVEIVDDESKPVGVDETASEEPVAAEPAAVEEPAPASHSRYEDRTVTELRDLVRSRGLPVTGSKDDLITRLRGGE
jgi:hypothetical protein